MHFVIIIGSLSLHNFTFLNSLSFPCRFSAVACRRQTIQHRPICAWKHKRPTEQEVFFGALRPLSSGNGRQSVCLFPFSDCSAIVPQRLCATVHILKWTPLSPRSCAKNVVRRWILRVRGHEPHWSCVQSWVRQVPGWVRWVWLLSPYRILLVSRGQTARLVRSEQGGLV